MSRSHWRRISTRSGGAAASPPLLCAKHLALRDLPDELERGDPAVRALAVLGQLLGRQFEVEDVAEKLLRLVVGEEKLLPVDDREQACVRRRASASGGMSREMMTTCMRSGR